MRAKQLLRPCVMLLLAGTLTAAVAQPLPCGNVQPAEREFARAIGACRDIAPIIDVAPKGAETAPPVVIPVPHVVGLSFDDARARLARFKLQRSYRPSAEPGGTVLAQQPAPPARLPAGFPVTVVLSDGTLGPAPRVTASDIDEVPQPPATTPDLRSQPSVVTNDAPTGQVIEKSPAATVVQPNSAMQSKGSADHPEVELLRVPNVLGMTIENARARLGRLKVERIYRPSDAPIGRVVAQIPQASARTAAGSAIVLVVSSGPSRPSGPSRAGDAGTTPVTETFELPNMIDRNYADASSALAEFKVDRIEMASAAPSGQVLAQDPAPGTSVLPGSAVSLQVSDGSLASAAVTTPAVTPEAATPAPLPIQSDRFPVTFPSNATLALVAGVLLGLVPGALLMRQWLRSRQPTIDIETPARIGFTPTEIDISGVSAADISFAARLDAGETTIEFTALSDADETTMEYSREHHE